MNHGFVLFALIWILVALPVSAHESSNPERDQFRMRIELEPAPYRRRGTLIDTFKNSPPRRRATLAYLWHEETARKSGKRKH